MQILDSEILECEAVLKALKAQQGNRKNLEAFRKEILGRFEEIGWVAAVKCWATNSDAVAFDVELLDRCERRKHGFDYERMQHEVVNDLLGLDPNKKGVKIPFSPEMLHSGNHKH